jgi:ABC-type uncharacterized transport system auxiliary subunit
MRTLMKRSLVIGAALLALGACSSSGPVPRDTYYRLGAAAPAMVRAGGPIEGVLEVPPFRAAGIVNERAILYRDGPRQLAQYTYHDWMEAPTVMLQRGLIGVLRQAQAFTQVTSPEMRLDRDFELIGDLRQWEHVRETGMSSVAIEVEISIRRVRDNTQVLLKTYKASEATQGDTVDAAVSAFTRGMDSIYAAVLTDLQALPNNAAR